MNQEKSRKPGRRPRSDQPPPQKSTPSPKNEATPDQKAAGGVFPIVGMGASAGGLEAFEKFFTHLPGDSGMAFVLVSHLEPEHASMMAELVSRFTPMPAAEVIDGMRVEANRVYTIPPNRHLAMDQGLLRLTTLKERRGLRLPIDTFFRSLAADLGERVICIILSGNGSDGTLGLQAIHGAGCWQRPCPRAPSCGISGWSKTFRASGPAPCSSTLGGWSTKATAPNWSSWPWRILPARTNRACPAGPIRDIL